MKTRKKTLALLETRTSQVASGLGIQDRALEQHNVPATLQSHCSLSEIQDRCFQPTRELNLDHIIDTARSIEEVGLIVPLAVDKNLHLIAGGHRLTALRLLQSNDRERFLKALSPKIPYIQETLDSLPSSSDINFDRIPVKVFDFDSSQDEKRTLKIESAENAIRRNYTTPEVLEVYRRLASLGYEEVKGRPSKDKKPIRDELAKVLGVSTRTIARHLNPAPRPQPLERVKKTLAKLDKETKGLSDNEKATLLESHDVQHYIKSLWIMLHQHITDLDYVVLQDDNDPPYIWGSLSKPEKK